MTQRRPGEWPVPKDQAVEVEETGDADEQGRQHLAVARIHARFEVTLGAIKADLEDQPSARSIRAAARRWQAAITAAADELIAERRRSG